MTGPDPRLEVGSQAHAQTSRAFRWAGFVKSSFDLIGSVLLIVMLAPIFAIVAILVFLDDGWPVIYRRRVVGGTSHFDAFKFRTMRRDADETLNANPFLRAEFQHNFKLKNDPRVTRTGAFLRKSSIDELPQILNVLFGQMSFVGPRILTSAELEKYGAYKALLLSVKPGMTGYWQVHGRQNVPYEERINMDVHYIKHWSLLSDLKILLLTPLKVVRGEGAH
jgi:lipopolysaccharide/colanic/teichoic acid biosynthesis glycosyltransferase